MNLMPALPLILPLFAGILNLFFWGHLRLQRLVSGISSVLILWTSILLIQQNLGDGIQVMNMGHWFAPFGITYVADLFSSSMVGVTGLLGLLTTLYAIGELDEAREKGHFHFLFQVLLCGCNGAFLTGDIFHLFVCFELLLMSSFVLMALGGERLQLEASIKYVVINLISSAFFLTGVGLLYGLVGSLNMADIAERLATQQVQSPWIDAIGLMLFLAFGIKAGLFPLFFWLPASYHTPPSTISALFAGLLTKVGIYSFFRVFPLIFFPNSEFFESLLYGIALLTMSVGVIGAVAQNHVRRILSVHIISQIGYIALGLALFSKAAIAAGIFYLIHNILAKTNLFFIAGIIKKKCGTENLDKTGGLYKRYPYLSLLFLISALGLAGVPPLSGFFAKLFLLLASVELKDWWAVGFSLGVGMLTLFSMIKIWNYAFWQKQDPKLELKKSRASFYMYFPVVCLAILIVLMGIFAVPVYEFFELAAESIFHRDVYIDAVLKSGKL